MADRETVLSLVESAYRQRFEVIPARASVSFVGVEQIEILRYPEDGVDHYLSLGMSRYAMVDPTETVIDESRAPRAELMVSARGRPDELWRRLAIIAAAPAVEGAVYGSGTRIDLGEPLFPGSRCTGFVLSLSDVNPVEVPGMSDVQVLLAVPVTASELAWARIHGSEELLALLADQGLDLFDLTRFSAHLV